MGGTVRKLTCNHEHEHEYIINCVGNEAPEETKDSLGNYCAGNKECASAANMPCPPLPTP
jgi:hypothetical protein